MGQGHLSSAANTAVQVHISHQRARAGSWTSVPTSHQCHSKQAAGQGIWTKRNQKPRAFVSCTEKEILRTRMTHLDRDNHVLTALTLSPCHDGSVFFVF